MSLKFGEIQPWTEELPALDQFKKSFIREYSKYFDDLLSGERLLPLGYLFLAHLSQRLIGELIGYSWSGVRPSSDRLSVVNNFKRLLLQNRLPDQCQILCGASLGRGNESLFAASGSHDQDGRHAHIW